MNDIWEIRPLQGLGPLIFGMPEAEATVIATRVYGDIEASGPVGHQSNDEIYRILVETMGEEEARAAMAELEDSRVDFRPTRRANYLSGVMLDFVEDRLDSIMCHGAASALHIGSKRFFNTDPIPALRQLQSLNDEAPLIKGPDCYFRNLHLTAFECIALTPAGVLRATKQGTDEASQKTIGWRAAPRNPGEDFSRHKSVSLLT